MDYRIIQSYITTLVDFYNIIQKLYQKLFFIS